MFYVREKDQKMRGLYWLAIKHVALQEGLCAMELESEKVA
jgi:hypothetical protein